MIYVEFEKPETLKEFLTQFFSHLKNGDDKFHTNVRTYQDKECKYLQCESDKYRSFDDLLECVNTYYPDVSVTELIEELVLLNPSSVRKCRLWMNFCSTINRPVMCFYDSEHIKLSSFIHYKGQSKYSWIDLLNMINIKTIDDFYNYEKQEVLN